MDFELPDEAGIVATYRKILGLDRQMLMYEASAIETSAHVFGAVAADMALAVGVGYLFGGGPLAVISAIASVIGFGTIATIRHTGRIRRGEASPHSTMRAAGPFSLLATERAFRRWVAANRRPDLVVDPTSLSVLEPVARYLAGPVLAEAALRANAANDPALALAAARAASRGAELRGQALRESDPLWRQAADEQAARWEDQARTLRVREAEASAARERIIADAEALRRYLDRLTERRRLLEEMSAARSPIPESASVDEGEQIRARLAALAESLRTGEALARDRVAAELEMSALERS